MDAVEAGKIYPVTRNGVEVAEPRPIPRRSRPLSAQELVERHRRLPPVDYGFMRANAEDLLGGEARVGDDDLGERSRG